MRTKAEVRKFLESRVGTTPRDASNAQLNGQCVSLIKDLMNFLGVGAPYAARGNAKDVGDTYIAHKIGTAGRGWLTVCVNRNMGGQYGHVWIDLLNEANYESNGVIALVTTKNTRPVQQAQQFINFDQWIKEDKKVGTIPDANNYYWRYGQKLAMQIRGRHLSREEFRRHIVGKTDLKAIEILSDDKEADKAQEWQNVGKVAVTDKWQQQIYDLQAELKKLGTRPTKAQLDAANKKVNDLMFNMEKAEELAEANRKRAEEMETKAKALEEEQARAKREADGFLTAILNGLRGMIKK